MYAFTVSLIYRYREMYNNIFQVDFSENQFTPTHSHFTVHISGT